jgi:hypothetical protein
VVEKESADQSSEEFADALPVALECYAAWAQAIDPQYAPAPARDAILDRVEWTVLRQHPDPRSALTLAAQVATSRAAVSAEQQDAPQTLRSKLRAAWFWARASSPSVLEASAHFRKATVAEREAMAKRAAANAASSTSSWLGALSTVASVADVTGVAGKVHMATQAAQVASVAGHLAASEATSAEASSKAAAAADQDALGHRRQVHESGADLRDALYSLAQKVASIAQPFAGSVPQANAIIAAARSATSAATVDEFAAQLGPFIGIAFDLPSPLGAIAPQPPPSPEVKPAAETPKSTPAAPAQAEPAAPAQAGATLEEKLQRLKALLGKKLITPADYETRKNKLLDAEVVK